MLITELCLEYKFFDATLWGPVVQRLQQLPEMHGFLATVLPYISTLPQLAHVRYLLDQAWYTLLASAELGEKKRRALLVQCASLLEFDLASLLNTYVFARQIRMRRCGREIVTQSPVPFGLLIHSWIVS